MPLIKLEDLFESMKEIHGPKYGFKPSQIKTKILGIKPGEKLVENLVSSYEMETIFETKDFFIIPPYFENSEKFSYLGAKKPKDPQKYFNNLKPLKKSEILKMLTHTYKNSI